MDVLIPHQGNGGPVQGHMIDKGDDPAPVPVPGLEGGQGPNQLPGGDPGPVLALAAIDLDLDHDLVVVLILAPGQSPGENLGQDLGQSLQ